MNCDGDKREARLAREIQKLIKEKDEMNDKS